MWKHSEVVLIIFFFFISRDVMEVLEINNFLKSPVFLYKCQEQELKTVLSISVVVGNRFCTVMLKNWLQIRFKKDIWMFVGCKNVAWPVPPYPFARGTVAFHFSQSCELFKSDCDSVCTSLWNITGVKRKTHQAPFV